VGARDDLDFFCREIYRTLSGIIPRIRCPTTCSRVTVSCHVSVEVRNQIVIVILECTQTGSKSDTVGVVLLLTCDTKNSHVTWPILSLVLIGLRLGSFSQNSV
jgi:hypothetical protein